MAHRGAGLAAVAVTRRGIGAASFWRDESGARGRRPGCLRVVCWCGLVLAVAPMTSRFGQEVRSYAVVTAAAVLAIC